MSTAVINAPGNITIEAPETEGGLVAHQHLLEELYDKNQTLKRIRAEFEKCSVFDFRDYCESHGVDADFGIDLLTQMALHRRTSLPTMVGILRHHFPRSIAGIQQCADAIDAAIEIGLAKWDPALRLLIVVFPITAEVQDELDRYQYPLPMVVPPREVRSNTDSGYLTSRSSLLLKNTHHDKDICLDHINRMNKVKFRINSTIAKTVKNSWRNLDKAKPGESRADFRRRQKAFEKYDRVAQQVIDLVCAYGEEFYLTHKYDKRGRVYCQGYHVNYQGAPWNKAVIELADKEHIV